jgi:YgiT-type zinc finger domain-containing protein
MGQELKKCVLCDGEIKGRIIDWAVEVDGTEYVIPDVPVMECRECGEKYLNPEASRYIDRQLEETRSGGPELEVRVLEARMARGKTQEEVARQMGFSVSRLSEIERNKKTPSILLALKLARVLDYDVNQLYRLRPVVKKDRVPVERV